MRSFIAASLAMASLAIAGPRKPNGTEWETAYTATKAADVHKAAATAKTSSPTSHVKGKAFDRIAIVYFENENYDKAAGDPNFQFFAKKGLTLTNYFAVTHPSQPNYMASIAGDYFGMENDDFLRSPRNVSTVIDLLEDKGISWGHYQEDMPYTGYEGFEWKNQENGANDYVRKHNPAVMHDSVAHYEHRLSQIKNLSMIDHSHSQFHKDLKANKLPQWMFITPNMTSDGHDTDVTHSGNFARNFLEPLLDDKNFMQNTLVLITWDENESYAEQNHILAIVVGDALPKKLVGTKDDTFYNHYSELATVQANWGLHTLGRWDVGANVYDFVARKTKDETREWKHADDLADHYYNVSYAGHFNSVGGNSEFPAPNLDLDDSYSGRTILPAIKKEWKHSENPTYYKDTIEVNDGLNPPEGYPAPKE